MLFHKKFYQTLRAVAETMKPGFSDKDFIDSYVEYYPYMMCEAQEMCEENKRYNANRKKYGYKTIAFPCDVYDYIQKESYHLLRKIRRAHSLGNYSSDEELKAKRQRLKAKCDKKIEQRKAKEEYYLRYAQEICPAYIDKLIKTYFAVRKKNSLLKAKCDKKIEQRKAKEEYYLRYAQEICPAYIDKLIKTYFAVRKKNSLDVNSRYLILLEAAQFKCEETRIFLEKVNACDKNNQLRQFAFNMLQNMGYNPWLARNRKGKQHLSSLKEIDIIENPTVLLEYIYKYQDLIHKRYDVFLSHSYFDTKDLLRLKRMLNAQGLVVYIDWVNDKVMLNRINQNHDTWSVLQRRMDISDKMIFVMTDNSLRSEWTPDWVNDKVMLNRINQNHDTWSVLQRRMDISDKMIFVMTDNSLRSEWTPEEINYFQKLGKQIYVLKCGEVSEKLFENVKNLPTCEVIDNHIKFN